MLVNFLWRRALFAYWSILLQLERFQTTKFRKLVFAYANSKIQFRIIAISWGAMGKDYARSFSDYAPIAKCDEQCNRKVVEWRPHTGKHSIDRPPTRWSDVVKIAGYSEYMLRKPGPCGHPWTYFAEVIDNDDDKYEILNFD